MRSTPVLSRTPPSPSTQPSSWLSFSVSPKMLRSSWLISAAPASEDASFRRYFRAVLDDGRSHVAMDAPPDKEDCRPFVHVAGLLREAGINAPDVQAQDLAQGFLLLSDLGTRTYLQEINTDNAARLFADATD